MSEDEIGTDEEIVETMRDLDDQEVHAQTIAQAFDVPTREVQPRLNRLADEGRIDRVRLGSESRLTLWRLADD